MLPSVLTTLLRRGLPELSACNTAAALVAQTRSSSWFSTSAPASTSQQAEQAEAQSRDPKLIVFGGRGFVGSSICKEAVQAGLQVTSISPAGTPPISKEPWVDQVTWVRGNALEPRTYAQHLEGSLAVVSCVGAFGSQEYMRKINGEANVKLIETAAASNIPKFVFVSAHIPHLPVLDTLVKGYIEGKKQAEDAVFTYFPKTGVCLRPSFIYGSRTVSTSVTVPLQLIGEPWKALVNYFPATQKAVDLPFIGALVTPPMSIQAVARAALHGATDPSVGGIIDVWEISKYEASK